MENKVYHFYFQVKGSDFKIQAFYDRIEEDLISAELGLRDFLKQAFGDAEISIQHLSALDVEASQLEAEVLA